MAIYTRTGDEGQTGLLGKVRVRKDDLRVETCGTLDETCSALGLARVLAGDPWVRDVVYRVQQRLFAVSSEIAALGTDLSDSRPRRWDPVNEADVAEMESWIDTGMERSGFPSGFEVPGFSPGSAALDLARTVARRAERRAVLLGQDRAIREQLLIYLNRLSDLIYVLARVEGRQALVRDVMERVLARLDGEGGYSAGNSVGSCASAGDGLAGGTGTRGDRGLVKVNLDLAKSMIARGEKKAKQLGVPMVIAVVDEGGNLVALHRMDGALLASIDVAVGKAFTAAAVRLPTNELARLAQPGGDLYGIEATHQGRIVLLSGGLPIRSGENFVGGIGASGGTPEQDLDVARAALEGFACE